MISHSRCSPMWVFLAVSPPEGSWRTHTPPVCSPIFFIPWKSCLLDSWKEKRKEKIRKEKRKEKKRKEKKRKGKEKIIRGRVLWVKPGERIIPAYIPLVHTQSHSHTQLQGKMPNHVARIYIHTHILKFCNTHMYCKTKVS